MNQAPVPKNTIEVEVLNEYFDFLDNGYQVRVAHFDDDLWFMSLVHRWNKNFIIIKYKNGTATIEKNRKIVKRIPSNF